MVFLLKRAIAATAAACRNVTGPLIRETDRREQRAPRSWLINGLKKIRTLDFLATQMTLGQAALKWLLAEPRVVTTLPNIYDEAQVSEFAAASDKPDLGSDQMTRVTELAAVNFGVDEEPMSYKGTMERVAS